MLFVKDKKPNLIIILGLIITGLISYPSTALLIDEWMKWDQTLSHGIACLALAIYFIWRLPFHDSSISSSPPLLAIILLTLSSVSWCIAQLGNIQLISQLLTITSFVLLIACLIPFQSFKKLLPALGILIFALPIWSGTTLVSLSSWAVNFFLQFLDLTLHIQGNIISTPFGDIMIADGCSGIRYLIIALLIAYLLWLLNAYSVSTGVCVFAIAITLALLTNWVRIISLVLIGYHTEMKHSLMQDHELFGWILFAAMLAPAIYFAPQRIVKINSIPVHFRWKKSILIAWLCGYCIYFLIPFQAVTKNPIQLPLEGFSKIQITPNLFLDSPIVDKIISTGVKLENTDAYLELRLSSAKTKHDKTMPYVGQIYNKYYWQPISSTRTPDLTIEVIENRITKKRTLLAYRYQVGPWTSPSYFRAKLLQIPAKLTNQSYFGFLSLQIRCKENCNEEIRSTIQFSNAISEKRNKIPE